jgi:hypothetical protein
MGVNWIQAYSEIWRIELICAGLNCQRKAKLCDILLSQSELWLQACLLADFVGSDPVKNFMSFNRDGFNIICIYGMIFPLPQKIELIFL